MVGISRILKAGGRLLFDPKFQDIAADTLRASKKAKGFQNFHRQIGDAFIKAEKNTKDTSLLKSMKESLGSLFPDIQKKWKAASGFKGKLKAILEPLWQRMPLIGVLLSVLLEIPNIVSAFQDKGFLGGIAEIGKSTARLAGSTAGFIIGAGVFGPIGGLVGGFAGDWLVSKIVGKSHSEKKAEAEENVAETQQEYTDQIVNNPYAQYPAQTGYTTGTNYNYIQPTMTPQQLLAMQQMLYSGGFGSPMDQDFMAMTSGINRLNYLC